MIKKITLKNIQSHKNSELEFSPFLNVIVGSSNQGKSAILRSIRWVKDNRPTSSVKTLNSYWNRDPKGNPIEEFSVTVENENGTVVRYRDFKKNGYSVNGNTLEAIKTDVPQIVSDTLRITDTNFQNQHDSAFLLTMSMPDATKYINQLCHLDSIDEILSNAEKNRKDVNSEIKICNRDIENCQKYLNDNAWIEKAENYCDIFDELNSDIQKLKDGYDDFDSEFVQYLNCRDKISVYEELLEIYELMLNVYELENQLSVMKTESFDYESADNYIKRIERFGSEINDLVNEVYQLNEIIRLQSVIDNCDFEIARLNSKLPKVCPLCGKPIGECDELSR